MIERRHSEEEEALLDRRRHLESAMDPTVPKTMKGPDAPTDFERAAHEISHLPPPWCDIGTWHRITSRRTPLERDARPIVAVDFAVRKARGDDGGADDDLETSLAMVDSSTGCMQAIELETQGTAAYLASSVADLVKNRACPKVQTAMRERTFDHGVAEKSEGEDA